MITGPPRTAKETAATVGLWTRPRAGAIWGGVWLVYLVPAFVEALRPEHSTPAKVVGFALLLAFGLTYIAAMLAAWDRNDDGEGMPKNLWASEIDPLSLRIGLALIVLAVASVVVVGEQGVGTFVFLSPVAASILPGRWAPYGIAAAAVATIGGELVARRYGADSAQLGGVLSSGFAALMAGFITLGVRRMRLVVWELQVARAGAEKLASAEERVRIARDLHDVLGHSLTVISMRSQLAGKLVERGEMERAGEEIRAVEELSRTAMSDVREAVAGYRIRPFAAELAAAEATLHDAGVAVQVERSAQQLPAAGEEALGFVVREGVTNVLRHSSARSCAISVRHTPQSVVVEVVDDGRGTGAPVYPIADDGAPAGGDGSGLRGLAERVAAAGGRLSAGDGPTGGFVLRAEVAR
jgi:two-component system sensor histidine kinase DesK